MVTCQICGTANRKGSRFCNECGRRLDADLACPGCGQTNPSDARFCAECGSRLGRNKLGSAVSTGVGAQAKALSGAQPEEASIAGSLPAAGPAGGETPEPLDQAGGDPSRPSALAQSAPKDARPGPTPGEPAKGFGSPLAEAARPPAEPAEPSPSVGSAQPSEAAEESSPVAQEMADEPPPEEERGLCLARSLAVGRPRTRPHRVPSRSLDAGRAFAAVAAAGAESRRPPQPPRRLGLRLLGLALALLLVAGATLAFGERALAVPAWAVESLHRIQVPAVDVAPAQLVPALPAWPGEASERAGQAGGGGPR